VETLAGRVGRATDELGSIVPDCNKSTLERYHTIGRVCGLALVNGYTLGPPFACYFLRAVLREPPTTLAEMQAEHRQEDPTSSLDSLLTTSLDQLGVADMLSFTRQTSQTDGMGEVPLATDPTSRVTDANKREYLRLWLEHQLVLSIRQQADAFREGVEEVTGAGCLSLLSPSELRGLWAGEALDDAHLDKWQAASEVRPGAELQASLFWTWLREASTDIRSKVLQFATGSSRLPNAVDLTGWRFTIDRMDTASTVTIEPTAANGLAAPAMCARSSTCSRTIYLPDYEDIAALGRGIECSLMDGGFGNA